MTHASPTDMTLPKGTPVRVRTTNGGEVRGYLAESYRPSYGVTLDELPRPIDGGRVRDVWPLCETGCGDPVPTPGLCGPCIEEDRRLRRKGI